MADTRISGRAQGPRGPRGPTGPAAAEGPPFWPPFPAEPVVVTIYARLDGSDTKGTGSLKQPYRTFQRAIRDVPPAIPPGFKYVVDITGIGNELVPDNYQLPEILSPLLVATADDPTTFPFRFTAPLTIQATPQPATNIPIGDTSVAAADIVSVTADPGSGLAILTVSTARPSWAVSGVKGKQLIGNASGQASCAVYDSNATQLFLCNQPVNVPAIGSYTIVEPSATLLANNPGIEDAAVTCIGPNSIAFLGIHFVCLAPGNSGLMLGGMPTAVVELCVVEGIVINACLEQVILNANVLSNGFMDLESSSITSFTSLWLDAAGYDFTGGESLGLFFRRTVFDGNPQALGPASPAPATSIGGLGSSTWTFAHCILTNTADNALHAFATTQWQLDTVVIENSAGDAILCEGSQMILNAVTGGGNTGFGVHVNDGGIVRVVDDGTLVTGTSGDMNVGTLVARTWTDFRTTAPIENEYDLTTPFVAASSGAVQPPGNELTGAGTGGRSGSRLFQRA